MIFIAGDHHAEPALGRIRSFLSDTARSYIEYGYCGGQNPSAGLQDFIPQLVSAVLSEPNAMGILSCGTGVGVEIGANRFPGIRASLCETPQAATWARTYDNANVLCIASWALDDLDLDNILLCWFSTPYDGSERRLEMFRIFDSWPPVEK